MGYASLAGADNAEEQNTAIGYAALYGLNVDDGDLNTGIGSFAGTYLADGSTPITDIRECTYLGAATRTSSNTRKKRSPRNE